MKPAHKQLADQVIVVTGASSGIGLATARLAVEAGARVVLTARDEQALAEVTGRITAGKGQAIYVVADVADEQDLERVAARAVEEFGRIDTWVNNAGVSIYGRIEDVSTADMRRLFDVTFWGVVHGCRVALPHLKRSAGTLINVGSVESEIALPLNGAYAAAKHAVKAFTDVLRMELEKAHTPVAVTLVKPGSIDTPFFEHAKTYLAGDPKPPPPVYAPEVVARTILECTCTPVRDVVVGGAARMQIGMSRMMPRLSDRIGEAALFGAQQRAARPGRQRDGSLYVPSGRDGRERGDYEGRVMRSSTYTNAVLHPVAAAVLAGMAAVAFAMLVSARRPSQLNPRRPTRKVRREQHRHFAEHSPLTTESGAFA